jgi:hypothetical protein
MKRPILHEHRRDEPCNATSCRVAALSSRQSADGWRDRYYEAWPEQHPDAYVDSDGIWRTDRRRKPRRSEAQSR